MTQNKRPVRPGQAPVRRPAAARPAGAAQGRPVQQRPAQRPARPGSAQPAQTARPQAQRSGGWKLPHDFWTLLVIGVVVVALGITAQKLWPAGFPVEVSTKVNADSTVISEIHSGGPVRINELMASNSATLLDGEGMSADWIEIINIGRSDVNLAGYTLAKTEKATNVFTFPECVLTPGECVIVYADSTLRAEAGEDFHAPFRLSSQGGTLMLFNTSGSAIDSVNFPAMASDIAYVREGRSQWVSSEMATPGMENTEASYRTLHEVQTDSGIEITEVVSSNTKYAADENGMYQDYFELHNTSSEAVDLGGWYVSDSVDTPAKWRLPEGFVLQPGEYKIVYASGLSRSDAAHPHANFGLSSEGEAIVLTDARARVLDQTIFDLLKTDEAWMKLSDGSWTTGTPTPNAANE